MLKKLSWVKNLLVLIVALVIIFKTGLVARLFAASPAMYFSACLNTASKRLYEVNFSITQTTPTCKKGDTIVSWSNTDLFGVTAGTGLSGGGNSGQINLSLASSYQLPQGCTNGQLGKWNTTTSTWDCGNDTSALYTAGQGLTLSGTEFSLATNGVTSTNLADDSVTSAKIANNASEPSRIQTWFNGGEETFGAYGSGSTTMIDPGITVTVPVGKAYYYLMIYRGGLRYYAGEKVEPSSGFYAAWSATPLANDTEVGPEFGLVQTGYREDWNALGAGSFWIQLFNASWVLRIPEGTHDLKIRFRGYSDNTMNYVHLFGQGIQVMRLY